MEGEIKFVGEMSSLDLGKDDILVVHADHPLSANEHRLLLVAFECHFPGHKCIVLDGGLKLGVLKKSLDSI